MRHHFLVFAVVVLLTASTMLPAPAQYVVHDPANAVILIEQKLNQATQIQRQVDQINNQLRNLRSYTFDWSSIADELRR
ncbi:MAG: hypothetical protein GIX03_15755, partial [Candidatus Eremiobacteraeota bacterium]|nr:hypothetical protein [Candidatus Eremiobacteraeota bacterium]